MEGHVHTSRTQNLNSRLWLQFPPTKSSDLITGRRMAIRLLPNRVETYRTWRGKRKRRTASSDWRAVSKMTGEPWTASRAQVVRESSVSSTAHEIHVLSRKISALVPRELRPWKGTRFDSSDKHFQISRQIAKRPSVPGTDNLSHDCLQPARTYS